ncbi:VrrA/YqfQ family protein [Bacillus massilinigeriensis]|uniref:VrrA/YqfQ family protein n=1 Tax=Bacillus massilionigeriensis TaxID=1805475 RepID=UPI00096ADD03|nr:VrrA/YqfQ family protein [Bacillus massilionigeriensis]
MPPRQRIPFQGGMPNPYMRPPMYGRPPMRPMRGNPPWMGMGNVPRASKGGGLLARILGRGNQARGMGVPGGFGRTVPGNPGGLLKSISNPSSITGFLQNTQKVLSAAQQIGPMVQQYGPLVKNLPAMWRLYKGLKDAPSGEEESNQDVEMESMEGMDASLENEIEEEPNDKSLTKQKTAPKRKANKEKVSSHKGMSKGASKPKLYI